MTSFKTMNAELIASDAAQSLLPNSFMLAALSYIERGWHVFPLIPKSKKPLTANGFKDASNDPDQVKRWWTENTEANIGIATGKISGFFVVDVDGEYPDNFPSLGALPTVKTRKGFHYYYSYPPDAEIKCSVKMHKSDVDIRADGGYIVAPPSIHPEGGQYEFCTE